MVMVTKIINTNIVTIEKYILLIVFLSIVVMECSFLHFFQCTINLPTILKWFSNAASGEEQKEVHLNVNVPALSATNSTVCSAPFIKNALTLYFSIPKPCPMYKATSS